MPQLYYPDDWLDYFRIILFFVSAYTVVVLLYRYRVNGHGWNTKSMDIWFGNLMWALSGCVFMVQAIALDRPMTVATVFVFAAILVSGKAVHKKGAWGSDAT